VLPKATREFDIASNAQPEARTTQNTHFYPVLLRVRKYPRIAIRTIDQHSTEFIK